MTASRPSRGALQQIRDALLTGVPLVLFDQLKRDLGVPAEKFCDVAGISTRMFAHRTDRFKPDESERLLRIAGVLHKADDMLEDDEAARH